MRRAWHAVGLARTAEAMLLGLGLALLAQAAAVSSGGAPGAAACWGPACAAGALMAAAWLLELSPRAGAVARRVDERLRLGGALVTAWEREAAGDDSPLVRLLARDVRRRVRVAQVVRAALPTSMPFLAAPLLGAAVLGWALGQRDGGQQPARDLAPALAVLASDLRAAQDAAVEDLRRGAVEREQLDRLAQAAQRARALADRASGAAPGIGDVPGDPAEAGPPPAGAAEQDEAARAAARLERELGALAAEVEALADEEPGSRRTREALERAAAAADAIAAGLTEARQTGTLPGAGDAGSEPSGEPRRGEPAGREGPEGAVGAGEGPAGLAREGADGRMVAPQGGAPGAVPPTAPARLPVADGPRAGGLSAGRWWPERDDGLVRRWNERTAAAARTPTKADD